MASLSVKTHMRAALLILSDKGSVGERQDLSGPALRAWLTQRQVEVEECVILPDEEEMIVAYLAHTADMCRVDLIITCGGTGVSPRDRTPEATLKVVERQVPGLAEAMRMSSTKNHPAALLSRAVAGIRGETLILNVPGSPQAALENLEAIWAAIPHAVAKIQGDTRDCAPV
ncbi:MAG: MogA/MoaB family molybdenum cofactor biosynthesis protein [Desulfuromonadaceae bacterium]|nr:MogA/MoaB family molybdenum cofactor biosynthesis protein [Desulfuromonadaceae bacterium]